MLTWGGSSVVPGSVGWLLQQVDLRVQLELRDELRHLRATADAVLAELWIAEPGHERQLEHAGDHRLAPTRYPSIESSVPSFEEITGRDGTLHAAVVTAVRIGRGMPRVGLAVIDASAGASVIDAVELAGARLEHTLVRAVSPRRAR